MMFWLTALAVSVATSVWGFAEGVWWAALLALGIAAYCFFCFLSCALDPNLEDDL